MNRMYLRTLGLSTRSFVNGSNVGFLRSGAAMEASRLYGNIAEPDAIQRVVRVVKDFHKVDEAAVKEESHFTNDLGLDSLDTVELVLALEDEFAVEIPEQEADSIQTVRDAINYVIAHPHAK